MKNILVEMKALLIDCEDADIEHIHGVADDLLCECLLELGHNELVELYRQVPKWFA